MTNDGGAAFPQHEGHAITGDLMRTIGGMSLRDWFAGQALAGLTGSGGWMAGPTTSEKAYELADAMLAERGRDAEQD